MAPSASHTFHRQHGQDTSPAPLTNSQAPRQPGTAYPPPCFSSIFTQSSCPCWHASHLHEGIFFVMSLWFGTPQGFAAQQVSHALSDVVTKGAPKLLRTCPNLRDMEMCSSLLSFYITVPPETSFRLTVPRHPAADILPRGMKLASTNS